MEDKPLLAQVKIQKDEDEGIHLNLKIDPALEPFVEILTLVGHQCNHITEFGIGSQSSTVILLTSGAKKIISYDFRDTDVTVSKELAKSLKIDFNFEVGNTLNINIEPTDMLYIDTQHTYTQLLEELRRHSSKVKKYIACHDTVIYRDYGELQEEAPDYVNCKYVNTRGLINAVREFVEEENIKHQKKMWKIIYDSQIWPGLVILERKGNE